MSSKRRYRQLETGQLQSQLHLREHKVHLRGLEEKIQDRLAGWVRTTILITLLLFLLAFPAGFQAAAAQPEPVQTLTFAPYELVTAVAWSPDGSLLAVGAGNKVHLYRVEGWQAISEVDLRAFTTSLAFSPDSRRLAASSRSGQVWLWRNVAGGLNEQALQMLEAHKKSASCVSFSPDGRTLASGGVDAIARLWNVEDGALLQEIIGGAFAVPDLAFAPQGNSLAVINSLVVRLRDPADGRISGTLEAKDPIYSLAYSPDGSTLAVGGSNNTIRLWDPSQAFTTANPHYPEPRLLVGHTGRLNNYRSLVWDLAYSPDGATLASAGGDGRVLLWESTATSESRPLQVIAAHREAATSLAFSPDGRRLASGGLDAAVRIWQVK